MRFSGLQRRCSGLVHLRGFQGSLIWRMSDSQMGFFGSRRWWGVLALLSRGIPSPCIPVPSFQAEGSYFIFTISPHSAYCCTRLLAFSFSSYADGANRSLLFMLETQPNWYHIRPFHSLGWHVGFWNLIGGFGFMLCGALGIAQAQLWAQYQSACSTFWGGWAFLIGSICQWVECLNR